MTDMDTPKGRPKPSSLVRLEHAIDCWSNEDTPSFTVNDAAYQIHFLRHDILDAATAIVEALYRD